MNRNLLIGTPQLIKICDLVQALADNGATSITRILPEPQTEIAYATEEEEAFT